MFFRSKTKAYSLVEIMVAISVVAIVIAMAASTYTRYLAKQMVVKAINATAYLRQAVEDYYTLYGYMPGNLDLMTGPGAPYITGYASGSQPKYTNPEPDIALIAYYSGGLGGGGAVSYCTASTAGCADTGDLYWRQVEVTFSNPTSTAAKLLSNRTFLLRANVNSGAVTWECAQYNWAGSAGTVDGTLLPASCYNSALNATG